MYDRETLQNTGPPCKQDCRPHVCASCLTVQNDKSLSSKERASLGERLARVAERMAFLGGSSRKRSGSGS
jgi:hypothetical protein